jgi:hypothetical protein
LDALVFEIAACLQRVRANERQDEIQAPFLVPINFRNSFHELTLVIAYTVDVFHQGFDEGSFRESLKLLESRHERLGGYFEVKFLFISFVTDVNDLLPCQQIETIFPNERIMITAESGEVSMMLDLVYLIGDGNHRFLIENNCLGDPRADVSLLAILDGSKLNFLSSENFLKFLCLEFQLESPVCNREGIG